MSQGKFRGGKKTSRPSVRRLRQGRAAFCAALALSLCCGLFSACGKAAAASSETTSSRAVSSEAAVSKTAAVSSAASSRAPAASVAYENKQYGLRVALPEDWKGYQVLTQQWAAFKVSDPGAGNSVFGPEIVLRSPKWTQAKPYQDIPIMIFSPEQWQQLNQDVIHIGAAPIGPRELARNARYVFALPARYNFAFPEGYEEVEKIIDSGAVTAFEWTL